VETPCRDIHEFTRAFEKQMVVRVCVGVKASARLFDRNFLQKTSAGELPQGRWPSQLVQAFPRRGLRQIVEPPDWAPAVGIASSLTEVPERQLEQAALCSVSKILCVMGLEVI
jgi:hypothetical protein